MYTHFNHFEMLQQNTGGTVIINLFGPHNHETR